MPHLRRDWAHRCHIFARDWAHPSLIRAGTGLTPPTSAPGTGLTAATSAPGPATAAQLLTVWRADQVAQDDAVPFLAPPLCACACVISLCGARGKPPLCPAPSSPQTARWSTRDGFVVAMVQERRQGGETPLVRLQRRDAQRGRRVDHSHQQRGTARVPNARSPCVRPRGACVRVRTGTGRMLYVPCGRGRAGP